LLLEIRRALATGCVDDHTGHRSNIAREFAIANRVLGHEPEQVRPPKESVERVTDLVAEPSAGRVETLTHQSGVGCDQMLEPCDVASVDRRHGVAKASLS